MLTDGKPGMENQCLGLAEALGLTPTVKRIAPRAPWRWLPPALWAFPLHAPSPAGDGVDPPWPDLLIATGRQTAAIAAAMKRTAGSDLFAVQIQDPRLDPNRFDFVVAPAHDGLSGGNVATTIGALHRVTDAKLAAAAARFAPVVDRLPHPRIAVLVGGSDRRVRLAPGTARGWGEAIAAATRLLGGGIMLTPSRRTGAEVLAAICAAFDDIPTVVWDGTGDNPYLGYLALADMIVVTADSVSMISEACATGKPVYIVGAGAHSGKLADFYRRLIEEGMARPFAGVLESWTYRPLAETARIAAEVRRRITALPNRQPAP